MAQNAAVPAPHPQRWLILFSVMAAGIMGPIDGSVVNVAMPTFSSVFNVEIHTVSWVSMAYLLMLGSLILTYGRLGDMFGFRRILLLGIVLFTAASAFCALSPNIWVLVFFRALQAIGAGMFMAMGPAIVTSVFPPQERGRALGTNGMIVAVGLALGPTLGGFLLAYAGWQSIFTINIPIGILGFLLCLKVIPVDKNRRDQNFDLTGAMLGFVALGSFLLVGSYGEEWGWTSTPALVFLALFVFATAAFIYWERRVEDPMLDLTLFENRVFSAANFASLMNFMSLSAVMFLLPFYLQRVLHFDARLIGLILTVSPAMMLILAPTSGALSDRVGTRWLAFTGQGLVALAMFLMSFLGEHSGVLDVVWRLAIFGLGTGIFQSPNNNAVMGAVPRHRLGVGSGMLATVRNVGMVLGIAVSSGVMTWQLAAYQGSLSALGTDSATAFMAGLKVAFRVGSALALLGALVNIYTQKKR
ncbi:MFS transporter [Heliobacterium chlorum]|uniref:MFS transporter n=1 Tax=Heliobacterium chlorum TaxID=2698 RepID=A0ABR7T7F6_HELCL|nr:MFS transporter [Heliobacterium chlorum]